MSLDSVLARYGRCIATAVTVGVTPNVTPNPPWIERRTPVTPVTPVTPERPTPWLKSDREPPIDLANWRELAAAYHAHHFNCPTCIAAGRGSRYGQRCGAGMALWQAYCH